MRLSPKLKTLPGLRNKIGSSERLSPFGGGLGSVPQLFSSPPRLGKTEGVDVDYLINLIMCCGEEVERKKQRYPN
jgi:hypothetical protein